MPMRGIVELLKGRPYPFFSYQMILVCANCIWFGQKRINFFGYLESCFRCVPILPVFEVMPGAYNEDVTGVFGVDQGLTGYIALTFHGLISQLPD